MNEQKQLTINDANLETQENGSTIELNPFSEAFRTGSKRLRKLAEHKNWLNHIRREFPSPAVPFRIGIYIRFFNQTDYADDAYLDIIKQDYLDTFKKCPRWTMVDFYIDYGGVAPNMESAPEWCRMLNDASEGKMDLIVTRKISNISKKVHEVTFCARLLLALEKPVGIYFEAEDIYTLASYYQDDLRDVEFLLDNTQQKLLEEHTDFKEDTNND